VGEARKQVPELDVDKQQKDIIDYQSEIRAKYKIVFKQGAAREVLGDILALCGFPGSTGSIHYGLNPDDKAMIGRFNVGLEIAGKAGVLDAIGTHILGINLKDK
jgi:hypothetical protein